MVVVLQGPAILLNLNNSFRNSVTDEGSQRVVSGIAYCATQSAPDSVVVWDPCYLPPGGKLFSLISKVPLPIKSVKELYPV